MNLNTHRQPTAGPKAAAILSVLESCRRLQLRCATNWPPFSPGLPTSEAFRGCSVVSTEKCPDLSRILWFLLWVQETESYSYRNASMGSSFIALRAGAKQAVSATRVSTVMATATVHGSLGLTP
jgi:hypothetical protein